MHALFIHQAFPAQFGQLALELTRRYGWRCTFLVQSLSTCPTPSPEMTQALDIRPIALPESLRADREVPWPHVYGRYLELCQAVLAAVRADPALRPDLVIAHGDRGAPTLFLPEALDCPIVSYAEYYFAPRRRDISYRIDLPPAEPAPFLPGCVNASTLVGLVHADAAYAATEWQRRSFPERFWPRIEVHFDGVDTALYRPRPDLPRAIAGRSIPAGTRVVTYAARGLESMRGFDIFMKVAARIARARPEVLFVVAGGEEIYYGWDRLNTGRPSFKAWVLEQLQGIDLSRFAFLGQVEPAVLADVLALSDLHIYLTVPFVPSWSLFDAMACGCTVLGADVEPVRELIEPGRTGLLEPFFDVDRLAEAALRVLDDPAAHAPLGRAARARIEEAYSLEVAVPELNEYFERVASRGVTRRL